MKTVGPFVAARSLDNGFSGAAQPVKVLHALDRLTGMPALVYLLPQAVTLPELPDTPSLLTYIEAGIQGEQAYVASELPPHAGLASDPLQTALGGLRALNALHEAGLVHGGVGPHQLWEWDGDVRLAGAALPWGAAQGALAAPEGGRSPAADLYALGVTLLRMGPLPAGLSDLLSPYPAQRPSARDALARFNAGPPLPTPPAPLMVQAPLHPREVAHTPAPDAPLPLIADPEQRVAPLLPAVDVTQPLPDDPVIADAAGLPVFDWEEVDSGKVPEPSGPHVAAAEPAGSEPAEVQPVETESAAQSVEIETLGAVTVIGAGFPATLPTVACVHCFPTDASSVTAPPDATESELLDFLAAFPTLGAPPQTAPLDAGHAPPLPEAEPAAEPPIQVGPVPDPAALTAEAQPVITGPSASPRAACAFRRAGNPSADKPRIGKPSADGPSAARRARSGSADIFPSTQTGQDRLEPGRRVAGQERWRGWGFCGHAPSGPADGPPPFVRPPNQSRASRSSTNRFNPAWLLALVVIAVLVVLLVQRGARSGSAATVAACCTVTAQLVGSSGQGLSAPVRVSVLSAPAESRLKAGALIGQAPGPLPLDMPGSYALRVVGDGYAAQTVNVTVPTTQPPGDQAEVRTASDDQARRGSISPSVQSQRPHLQVLGPRIVLARAEAGRDGHGPARLHRARTQEALEGVGADSGVVDQCQNLPARRGDGGGLRQQPGILALAAPHPRFRARETRRIENHQVERFVALAEPPQPLEHVAVEKVGVRGAQMAQGRSFPGPRPAPYATDRDS